MVFINSKAECALNNGQSDHQNIVVIAQLSIAYTVKTPLINVNIYCMNIQVKSTLVRHVNIKLIMEKNQA